MPFTLNNPPVQEAWIGFNFKMDEETPPSWEQIKDFLEKGHYCKQNNLDILEPLTEVEVQISKTLETSKTGAKLKLFRAHNTAGDRFVFLSPKMLQYNMVRLSDTKWPEFHCLRKQTLEVFKEYTEIFPRELGDLAIGYIDIIEIPVKPNGSVSLGDYFTYFSGKNSNQNSDNSLCHFDIQNTLSISDPKCTLFWRLHPAPFHRDPDDSSQTQGFARFRMEWRLVCPMISLPSDSTIADNLNTLHDNVVLSAFRGFFTDACWELFKPEDNNK